MTRHAAPFRQRLLPLLAVFLAATSAANARCAQDEADPTSGPVLELSLRDALRLALENNLDLEAETLNTEIAHYDALGSWGAFDPLVSTTGTLSESERQGDNSLAGADVLEEDNQNLDASVELPHTWGGSLRIDYTRRNRRTNNRFAAFDTSTTDILTASVNQPLLRGGFRRYATTRQREAEVTYQRALESEKEMRNRVVLDVFNAYWDLVSAVEELEVRKVAVNLGQKQLEQDRRRLEVGAGTEVDVLQSQTNLAQQEEARIQAEFDLRAAEDALRKLLFQETTPSEELLLAEWDWPIRPATQLPEVNGVPPALAQLNWRRSLQVAIEVRPEVKQRRYDVAAAEVRLTGARSDRLPSLDLDLSATGVGFDSDPAEALRSSGRFEFPEYRGALTFSMPLGNRTANYALRAARAALRSAYIAYDKFELDLLSEVRAAVRDVRFRVESVAAAKTSLELARRQLEAEEARREIGLSTTFQVLEFQRDLAEALSAEQAARSAYAKAVGALAHAEGNLIEGPAQDWSDWDTGDKENRASAEGDGEGEQP